MGGGGLHVHPMHPLAYAPEIIAHHSKVRIAIMRHCYKRFFQDMRDLLYFVIICQLLASEATQQCFISASHMSISGWMLQRHIYKTMPADLGLRCLLECRTDNRCQSFNFVLSRRMCEFSNRTKKATPQDFVPDPDRYYFTRQNNRGK